MLLRPRKKLVPVSIQVPRQEPVPAYCAFCRNAVSAPPRLPGATDLRGSRCTRCEALVLADPTGKQGGEALLAALGQLAGGDDERAMALREGVDYEVRALAWHQSSNEVDPSQDATRYGVGRLWFFRALSADDSRSR